MYTGDASGRKKNVFVILGIVIALVVGLSVAAFFGVNYWHDHNTNGLTTESFTLKYENPTDQKYYIVLDNWDTITVEPFSACDNLDYTHKRDQISFHWQMLDENQKVIADTTVSESEITEWFTERNWDDQYNHENTIILNPSLSDFVYWTMWFGVDQDEYVEEVSISDSVYVIDGEILSSAFIFDPRDPNYITELEYARPFSDLERNEFLISDRDFMVLYSNIYSESGYQKRFNRYRNALIDLFNASRAKILTFDEQTNDQIELVNRLDSLIPQPVTNETEPREFVEVINLVRYEEDFFRPLAISEYDAVTDSADLILKRSYSSESTTTVYPALQYFTYWVERDGFWDDQPVRRIQSDYAREEDGSASY